jgi:hypothetical protein
MVPIDVFTVPPSPSDIAVDTASHMVYIASDTTGYLTEFNGRTLQVTQTVAIGGHPGGIAVVDNGQALLVTDEQTGLVQQRALTPTIGLPEDILPMAPGPTNIAQLSTDSAWIGSKVLIWGRDFNPGERVSVMWEMVPIETLKADVMGSVAGQFTVPRGVTESRRWVAMTMGEQLIELMGKSSNHSESTVLTVVPIPPPPPPKVVPKKVAPPPSLMQRITNLLDSSIQVPPAALAVGPLKGLQRKVPTMDFVIAYIVCTILLIVIRVRRQRTPAKPNKKQLKRRPPKRLAIPAEASS